ncbi:hypothetical protein MYP14_04755 [Rhodococcus pyridinivorans]|uniref:hypothetical protein n=1 Tax=Rhodococcus pyridinivorans TaxID=103816 RepID=UPI001FFF93B7|nr:hypothetical protein [Rhodococcus pyridinivorans]UPK64676.1 hypothetical protein MYP14_04755 [Rhodococcus pyridinivorans]
MGTDYWRSLRRFGDGKRDVAAALVIFGLPIVVFFVALFAGARIAQPTGLLSAVALLSGVLLAAAGQILTMRARIADSLTLSANDRVTSYIRETMSGLILAAVAAFFDALLLGALAALGDGESKLMIVLSSTILMVTTYLSAMFIVTARRLYQTYLEVFEGGSPLPRRTKSELREQRQRQSNSLDVS